MDSAVPYATADGSGIGRRSSSMRDALQYRQLQGLVRSLADRVDAAQAQAAAAAGTHTIELSQRPLTLVQACDTLDGEYEALRIEDAADMLQALPPQQPIPVL